MKREFKAGDLVAVVRSSAEGLTVLSTTKVAKVYKNGNFILDRDPARHQWRQDGFRAGDAAWSMNFLVHRNSSAYKEALQNQLFTEAKSRFRRLAEEALHSRMTTTDYTKLADTIEAVMIEKKVTVQRRWK